LHAGREGEKGQVMYLTLAFIFFLLAASAFVVDFGRVVHAQRELQASADAAATAGGVDLPNGALATQDATNYSAVTGNLNATTDLPNVAMVSGYPKLLCLNTLSTDENMPCTGTSPNAIQVKEQVTVPLYFAKIFGWNSVTLTATATSSARGGVPHPLNVIIIMDTTASMQTRDPNCTVSGIGSPSQEDCAKAGVRTLLGQLWPCAPNLSNCGAANASGNVPNPVDKVGMMVFPGLSSSTYNSWEYTSCQANKLVDGTEIVPYQVTTNYLIIAPASDYRSSDTAAGLNASSNLVQTVDFADEGCTPTGSNTIGGYGLQDPGGEGTYYAGAICCGPGSAQATFPTSGPRSTIQNVIILLSDGDASSGDVVSPLSATNQCAQGVTAAQNAAALGTWVYTIAYNSNNSSGCSTDSPKITPCAAMKAMANSPGNNPDPNKFYADGNSANNGCVSAAHPSITSLQQIFQTIGADLLTTQLIPNNTT
jgi:Flp pilus assembly protein TadG